MNKRTIALIGNPNVGKTTIFNALTGAHQTVGNWPGVTVEGKFGEYDQDDLHIQVVDLPGIYSLSANSPDEKVTRDYLLSDTPNLVVNVVDASNLERNLYLTTQLMEMNTPMVIVLTMLDLAEKNHVRVDVAHLHHHLNIPIIPLEVYRRHVNDSLRESIARQLTSPHPRHQEIRYDEVVEKEITRLTPLFPMVEIPSNVSKRWMLVRQLEQTEPGEVWSESFQLQLQQSKRSIEKHRAQRIQNVITDDRYGFIHGLMKDVVNRKSRAVESFSDRIDRFVLSSVGGLPIFFFIMFVVFSLTIRASQPFVDWIEQGMSWLLLTNGTRFLSMLHVPVWMMDFLTQGIGNGVIVVLTFVPPIFFIFASLAILEDSGYMARAVIVADKVLRKIGLPGKAFIPLLLGFGCSVPAIMASRTLESKRDRLMASLLTPFMSCGAKLPVYTFLSFIFFPQNASLVIFGLYMFGIVMALLTGLLLRKTLFTSPPSDFIMELPAYHVPTINGVMMHTWHRLQDFVLRAGKTILLVIIVLYILQTLTLPSVMFPEKAENRHITLLEATGRFINPIFHPMGITDDNWHASVALISGLMAKEAVVGSLQALYTSKQQEPVAVRIRQHFGSQASGLAYLLFILLYSPCAAALTMLWKEHGLKWMLFSFTYLTLLAWIIAVLFYQVIEWNKQPAQSAFWMGICVLLGVGMAGIMKLLGKGRLACPAD